MMGGLTDRLPAILKGLAEGHPGLREQFELARAALIRGDINKIRHGRWPVFLALLRVTTDNKKGTVSPLLVGSMEPRG